VRAGAGPRLLHALTYRMKGHVSVDPASYRDANEVEHQRGRDPIALAEQRLLALSAPAATIESIRAQALAEVAAAVEAARAAPWPDAAAAYTDVQDVGNDRWY